MSDKSQLGRLEAWFRHHLERLRVSARSRRTLRGLIFSVGGPFLWWNARYQAWKRGERLATSSELPRTTRRTAAEEWLIHQMLNQAGIHKPLNPDYVPDVEEFSQPQSSDVKPIAFYLPQFHQIPENDTWWGRGFTEWTNVSKAVPQFVGHYQPRLPGELGFYDLNNAEVMERQIALAQRHGIFGFCFHYYWFSGRRLLEAPIMQFLKRDDWSFPFCLCWANENWTRRWDGYESEILMAQNHHVGEESNFIRDIEPWLRDRRYIRVNGKLLLIVYRPGILPDAAATAAQWREHAKAAGLGELHLVAAQAFVRCDPRDYGFDAAVEFPPHCLREDEITDFARLINRDYQGTIRSYAQYVERSDEARDVPYRLYPGVMPSWDNEARRPGRGRTYYGATPELYGAALSKAIAYARQRLPESERFVFINAWNEWGEGAHLEPDRRFGYGNLRATRAALASKT